MKDIASILFKISGVKKTPAAGSVLIAEPFLKDTFYTHGVMSIIDYVPEDGATGVILNNRSEYKLADLLDNITVPEPIPVFCGGSTGQDRLFFIHTLGPDIIADARPYAPGLYVGGQLYDEVSCVE